MARLIPRKALNHVVAHLEEVNAAIHKETNKVEVRAQTNLSEARASTRWHKIFGPGHLTKVDADFGEVDGFVNLHAPNPMAIEFGHQPSGVFGPDGKYGHLDTKSPDGLYILTKASGIL
jgi:hypothetical protein